MPSVAILLVLWTAVGVSVADLPVQCNYDDILGHWTFWESERNGTSTLACNKLDDISFKKDVTLRFPNTAEDELGNIGTWTMVYDQGFEVIVAGRSYFAFNYFENNGDTVLSFCDKTFPGWARDLTVRNWSCFRAEKSDNFVKPRTTYNKYTPLFSEYRQDARFVDTINRHQSSWTAAIYPQFHGLSLDTIYRMRGGQYVRTSRTKFPNHESNFETKLRVAMLPKSFDWRNVSGVNYVRPVKNQGECGSCYAFASIGVIESQLLINSGGREHLDLSAEDIVGCSLLSQGCDGGFPYLIAGRYAQDVGLVSEECIPYNISGECNTKRNNCRHVYTTEYKYIGGYFGACNEDEMLVALTNNGPLAVGIEVQSDFMNYKGGIYHHTGLSDAYNKLEETNHAVLLVGYGVSESGEKYWIIQNSWGTGWGVDGYVYIRRGTDEIAVESMAVQAIAYP